jgi:hypothetical protein
MLTIPALHHDHNGPRPPKWSKAHGTRHRVSGQVNLDLKIRQRRPLQIRQNPPGSTSLYHWPAGHGKHPRVIGMTVLAGFNRATSIPVHQRCLAWMSGE